MKDPLEEALEKLEPAELPPALMARLTAARPQAAGPRVSIWRRWLFPLTAGAMAATMMLAYLYKADRPAHETKQVAAAKPLPFVRNDYLLGAREVGLFVAPNQQPYRMMEIEWLEQDTISSGVGGPAIRVEKKRRDVVPVALEIF